MAVRREIEICVGSYVDCLAAFRGGVKRVELNSALSVGGLSPSLSVLRRVKKETDLKVICMVRPRAAGFCYTREEKEIMFDEAALFLSEGADGIAFGFLKEDRTVDVMETGKMTELIHNYQKEAVFHRAFDVTPDADVAMEALISCKIDRVLTSGQAGTAIEGMEKLAELQRKYGNQIEILAGSGVHAGNVVTLLEKTGIRQVHSSCRGYRMDATTVGRYVNYSYLPEPHEREYDAAEEALVKGLVRVVEGMGK